MDFINGFDFSNLKPYWVDTFFICGLIVASLGLNYILLNLGQIYLKKSFRDLPQEILLRTHFAPWSFLFIVSLIGRGIVSSLYIPKNASLILGHLFFVSTMICGGWLSARIIRLAKILFTHRFDMKSLDNNRARGLQTQIQFIEKVCFIVIGLTVCGVTLASFESAREIGGSILASAGIVGVVAGFAAQRSLANLFAGFQIAFTQPIRLDDVVVLENQWGRIEEITFTYVVVCLWDLRRLVVPINYFIEKPFENWTRNKANLLPFVLLFLDYSFPVDVLRKEFERVLKLTPLWDGQVGVMQVIDSGEKTMTVRALMSALNSGQAFDLRCFVRERLIAFIQKEYPDCLPKVRFSEQELSHNGPLQI